MPTSTVVTSAPSTSRFSNRGKPVTFVPAEVAKPTRIFICSSQDINGDITVGAAKTQRKAIDNHDRELDRLARKRSTPRDIYETEAATDPLHHLLNTVAGQNALVDAGLDYNKIVSQRLEAKTAQLKAHRKRLAEIKKLLLASGCETETELALEAATLASDIADLV